MPIPALVDASKPLLHQAAVSGNTYLALSNLVAGLAIPIYSNTAQTMGIWNRSTNKALSIIDFAVSSYSTGPLAIGGIGFAVINAGISLGTPISATVQIATCYNTKDFTQANSADFLWCSATVAAPTLWVPSGISSPGVYAVTTATSPAWCQLTRQYDGRLIVPPGVAFFISGSAAQTHVMNVALTFQVIPL
jgi:hypothetical protein